MMTEGVVTFGPNYNAKASTAGALAAAEELLKSWQNRDMPYEELSVRIAANRFWVEVAQVHATAALVYATEEATQAAALAGKCAATQKKTCRCL